MTDLYKTGNVLKKALRDDKKQLFVMVCDKHPDYRDDYFRAVVICSGKDYEKPGTIHNNYNKGKWELSSLSEAAEFSYISECSQCDNHEGRLTEVSGKLVCARCTEGMGYGYR